MQQQQQQDSSAANNNNNKEGAHSDAAAVAAGGTNGIQGSSPEGGDKSNTPSSESPKVNKHNYILIGVVAF